MIRLVTNMVGQSKAKVVRMKKSISMQGIADKLGVSKNSVYLALNDKPGVSGTLKQRIRDAAISMGYGEFPAKKQNVCIPVIVPEYLHGDMFFYADVFWAIDAEARRQGYLPVNTVVSRDAEARLEMPAMPMGMMVAGLLIVGILSKPYVKKLYELGLPMLSVDIHYPFVPISCVETDNFTGAYDATQYLIDAGHVSIGFVGPIYSAQSVYARWSGYRQAMDENQLPVDKQWCIRGHRNGLELFDTAEALLPHMEALEAMPTAWLCAGDRIAVAVVNLMQRRGLRVPEDVSVMGFDDLPVSEMILPKLSTMHVQRKRMGRIAVDHLINADNDDDGPITINLSTRLVTRDSVASPRSATH